MNDKEKEIYNKAIDDALKEAKMYGLISTELGFSILQEYRCKEISEEVLWNKLDEMAQNELYLALDNLKQTIGE